MTRLGLLSTLTFVLIAGPFLVSPPFAHADGRWALSLSAGPTDRFTYRTESYSFGDYSERFGFSGLAVVGTSYRLTDRATLRADVGYLGYQKSLAPVVGYSAASGTLGMWPNGSMLTAQMPFVSTGVRLYEGVQALTRPRFYVEALPTLWVSRWRERLVVANPQGNLLPSHMDQDAFTSVEAGFSAGAGLLGSLAGRTKLDVGLRYLFSTAAGPHNLGHISSGDFSGLRQLALVIGLHRDL